MEKCLVCTYCKKTFTMIHNLNAHLRKAHKVQSKEIPRLRRAPYICRFNSCSEDPYTMNNIQEYRHHLENSHNVIGACAFVQIAFKDITDFKAWKTDREKEDCALFVQHCGPRLKSTNNTLKYHYYCNRSGFVGLNTNVSRRRTKMLGSCKIDSKCPASMVLECNNENYIVTFYSTHFGHEKSIEHLRLPTPDKRFIAEKLAEGLSKEKILNEFKLSKKEKLSRSNMLFRSDIDNISRSKLGQIVQHHFEGKSLSNSCFKIQENQWQVFSETTFNKSYIVTKNDNNKGHNCPPSCNSMCHQCNSCLINWSCTCEGYTYQGNLCKHIHAVILNQNYTSHSTNKNNEALPIKHLTYQCNIIENNMYLDKSSNISNLNQIGKLALEIYELSQKNTNINDSKLSATIEHLNLAKTLLQTEEQLDNDINTFINNNLNNATNNDTLNYCKPIDNNNANVSGQNINYIGDVKSTIIFVNNSFENTNNINDINYFNYDNVNTINDNVSNENLNRNYDYVKLNNAARNLKKSDKNINNTWEKKLVIIKKKKMFREIDNPNSLELIVFKE